MKPCSVLDIGLIDYKKALECQQRLFEQRRKKNAEDTLVLAEHFPVYTCGRSVDLDSPTKGKLIKGANLVRVDYDDSIAYHGPGQLMIYPVIKLPQTMSVQSYIQLLEAVILRTLAVFGIKASKGQSDGVWAGSKKLASVSVKVSSGCTMHGMSLNVNCNLKAFEPILPFEADVEYTSMSKLLGYEIEINDVKDLIILNFGKILNYKLKPERKENKHAGITS